jgi:transcriptional regulator with XRE-family HTH domain
MKFGTNLCKHRKNKKLSQTDIASQIGTHQSTYNAWESDKTALPAEFFIKLAYAFDVDLQDLVPEEFSHLIRKKPVSLDQLHPDLIASQQLIALQQAQLDRMQAELDLLRQQAPQRN